MKNILKEKKYTIILIAILLVGIITRIIGFGEIPIGINVDGAGIMYDAYCIANYGTDRFDNNYPIYMINFGGGQSALYTYLVAGLIKIFGFSLTVVRIPALVFSILYLIFAFLIIKDFKNKKLAILVEFIAVIIPWHFMQSRWAFDCNLMSSMMLISIYTLLKAKKPITYILAGILFGITLYTYALSYVIIPIFLLLILGYMLYTKKIRIRNIVVMFIPLIILAIPLLLYLMVNFGWIPEIKTSYFSILKMWEFRTNEISISNIITNILRMFKCIFAFDHNDFNAFPIFGTVYYISIPFAIIGFVQSIKSSKKDIKEKKLSLDIVMLINFVAVFICGLIIEPQVYRINAIFISIIYYIAVGMMYTSKERRNILIAFVAIYIVMFTWFLCYYFGVYGKENQNISFNESVIEVTNYIEENEKFDGKYINMRVLAAQQYIYTLLVNKTPPKEFIATANIDQMVYGYDRYIFYNFDINDNTVYVLESENEIKQLLEYLGFTREKFNDTIDIFYME